MGRPLRRGNRGDVGPVADAEERPYYEGYDVGRRHAGESGSTTIWTALAAACAAAAGSVSAGV